MTLLKRSKTVCVDITGLPLELCPFDRKIDDNHVMVLCITAMYDIRQGIAPSFPPLCVARIPIIMNKTKYYKFFIIDGQHRYMAYKKLQDSGHIFDFDVQILHCNNMVELQSKYDLYNNKIDYSIKKETLNTLDREIQFYVMKTLGNFFTKDKKKSIKIDYDKFFEKYWQSEARKKIHSVYDFMAWIALENQNFKDLLYHDIPYYRSLNLDLELVDEAIREDIFLGLDVKMNWLI